MIESPDDTFPTNYSITVSQAGTNRNVRNAAVNLRYKRNGDLNNNRFLSTSGVVVSRSYNNVGKNYSIQSPTASVNLTQDHALSLASPSGGSCLWTIDDINVDQGFTSCGDGEEDTVEEDPDDIVDNVALRTNMNSSIMRSGKDCLFNSSMILFNDVKNGPPEELEKIRTPKGSFFQSIVFPSERSIFTTSYCGPKSVFQSVNLASPQPKNKDRSIDEMDEIDEIIFETIMDHEQRELEKHNKLLPVTEPNASFLNTSDKENIKTRENILVVENQQQLDDTIPELQSIDFGKTGIIVWKTINKTESRLFDVKLSTITRIKSDLSSIVIALKKFSLTFVG